MTKQRAKELAGSLINFSIPAYIAGIMCLGAAALGVVAGPPIIALASPEKAAELVGQHCATALTQKDLDFERERNKMNNDFNTMMVQMRDEHSKQLIALRDEIAPLRQKIVALEKDVCVLQAGIDGRNIGDCLE